MKHFNCFWLVLFSLTLQAQNTSETIHANNIEATVNSNGAFFWDFLKGQFLVPSGSDQISTIRSSGLWLAGLDENGFLHGAVQMYNQNGKSDFEPGILSWNNEVYDDFNLIWKVTKTDIDAHIDDFEDNGVVDNPLASIFGYPGYQNSFFESYNNFELPANVPVGVAPFFDINNNGRYDPDLGDYPIVAIRGCEGESLIIPDEMLWFAYHDFKVHTESQMEPMKIALYAQVFAFNCNENPILNNTVFVHHKITNYNEINLDSTHIALFTDFDIGCANDDFIGCDPERNVYFAYNADNADSGCNNAFGSNPPVQAAVLLRGPLAPKVFDLNGDLQNPGPGEWGDTIVELSPTFYVPFGYNGGNMGTPSGPDYFNYLSGTWKDGSAMENNGVFYDGEPANPEEWSEVSDFNLSGDRRMLATFGPFDLNAGAINEVIVAYSAYRDTTLSHLENVSSIYYNTDQLMAAFDNCFEDVCSYTVGTNAPAKQPSDLRVYPNPNDGNFVLEYESGDRYEVLDVAGRVLASGSLPAVVQHAGGVYTFDISTLNQGIYFLKVSGEKGSSIEKFVLNYNQ